MKVRNGDSAKEDCREEDEECVEIMGTPERSKNCCTETSFGNFEDSPVFDFIDSLSPIKPLKSTQMINPLSFASLPSVFTSPQTNTRKESRFPNRHPLSDPSKHEFSGPDAASRKSDEQKENVDPVATNCDSISPNYFLKPCSGIEIAQDGCKESFDWETLVSGASDLSTFESRNDKKPVDPAMNFYARIKDAMQNLHSIGAVVSGLQVGVRHEPENSITAPTVGGIRVMESTKSHNIISASNEHLSGFYHGVRRRCLVFEMAGGYKEHLDENALSQSSPLRRSEKNSSSLPGIGLHLNAVAATPKDYKIINEDDASASGRLLIGPSSSDHLYPSTSGQELFISTFIDSLEREIDAVENGIVDDAQEPLHENNNNSPRMKRRRLEQASEGGTCKRCNCKKSRCLKLYCECFAGGVYCMEPCACIDCFNKPGHEETVVATRKQIESRNPLAFAPKVIRGCDSEIGESSKTPASARHKRGCNCKKSGCLKKYCECYQSGVGCSINCRCEGCKNAFGKKDVVGMEADSEEDDEMAVVVLKDNKNPAPNIKKPRSNKSGAVNLESKDKMSKLFLRGIVKSSSPNRKRVFSSPQRIGESSSRGGNTSRKLMLHSIPSFPSLAPKHL